jgi:hypothetical protein
MRAYWPSAQLLEETLTSGSDPNLGMLCIDDHIRNGPTLSSGQRPCLAFIARGKVCMHGRDCRLENMVGGGFIDCLQT